MPAEETQLLSPSECIVAAERFEQFAALLRKCHKATNKTKGIWVFRKPSLRFAIDRGESFASELNKSIEAMRIGRPYSESTPKNQRLREN